MKLPPREESAAFFSEIFGGLTKRGKAFLGRQKNWQTQIQSDLAKLPVSKLPLVTLAELLLSRKGEASGVALAQTLLHAYHLSDAPQRLEFLMRLALDFGSHQQAIARAIAALSATENSHEPDAQQARAQAMEHLHHISEPRRQSLLRRLNLAPHGTADLVAMREDVLKFLPQHSALKPVDDDFGHLFASWFNRGFLMLKPIDWKTPANILEKIIRYEAVHEIKDWNDLRNRLEPEDRRCYGFFHPQLIDEPLIFVEVALTKTIPNAVAPLLDLARQPIDAREATTATFYSISNTQRGLAGVSFGHFLIKQVAEDLKKELPNLQTFVTLSPVPGFAKWLARERMDAQSQYLDAAAKAALGAVDDESWYKNLVTSETLRPHLLQAAAQYFTCARRDVENKAEAGAIDPVARFHLGNGARLERLNYLGDVSSKGLRQSYGLMVNYLYDLNEIETNHEAYAEKGEFAIGRAVKAFLPSKGS